MGYFFRCDLCGIACNNIDTLICRKSTKTGIHFFFCTESCSKSWKKENPESCKPPQTKEKTPSSGSASTTTITSPDSTPTESPPPTKDSPPSSDPLTVLVTSTHQTTSDGTVKRELRLTFPKSAPPISWELTQELAKLWTQVFHLERV